MATTAGNTVSQQTVIKAGDSQGISFRPQLAGTIFIQSTPPPAGVPTETGMLAMLQLFRPGITKPLKTLRYPRDSQSFSLAYSATPADLATPGNWTAVVTNASLRPLSFTTSVTYPIANTVMTASVDIGFLNLILSKVFDAASIKGHIETSKRDLALSHVTLSPDIASLLKQANITSFHVSDFTVHGVGYRIKNLDSDPAYPMVAFTTSPLGLNVAIRIDPGSVKFEALGPLPLPDVQVKEISVALLIGLDGGVTASCRADVTVKAFGLDLSDTVSGAVLDGINGLIHGNSSYAALFAPSSLRSYIDLFFASFMRLGRGAKVQGYAVKGNALEVSYIL